MSNNLTVPSDASTYRTRHALQVSLMRQMEKSTRDFADWRKEREKEVMQLRRQVRAHTLPLHYVIPEADKKPCTS